MIIKWKYDFFDKLTAYELYTIIRLRNEVFVVEQNCVYQDLDNKDQICYHLCGWDGDNLVAYARLLAPGISYEQSSIGRIVSSPAYRKHGAGRELVLKAIDLCLLIFDSKNIKIGAQLYLKKFYESLGFVQCSEGYLEDDIAHITMFLEG